MATKSVALVNTRVQTTKGSEKRKDIYLPQPTPQVALFALSYELRSRRRMRNKSITKIHQPTSQAFQKKKRRKCIHITPMDNLKSVLWTLVPEGNEWITNQVTEPFNCMMSDLRGKYSSRVL